MTNELIINEENDVKDMIYEIRGRQVMLDSDLAKLYQCKNGTKDINKAVSRNRIKFPNDFYFQLNKEEVNIFCSRFQIGTLNKKQNYRGSNIKYMPSVFTEEGVSMLATILKTEVATEISIKIMRTFSLMRKYISSNLMEQRYINNQVFKNTEDIKLLQESFDKLTNKEKNNHIFFQGQIYDAYSLLIDILNNALENIIIIDNYLTKELLDIISNVKVNVTVITGNYRHEDINKYQEQYSNLTIITNHTFHDRFIIIDNKILYHCGSSFKDLGTRCFAINKMEDNRLIEYIKTLI